MFIHIGGDIVVRAKNVIAILDVNNPKRLPKNHYFLDKGQNEENMVKIASEETKSIIITDDKIYYSPISSLTLKKRSNGIF